MLKKIKTNNRSEVQNNNNVRVSTYVQCLSSFIFAYLLVLAAPVQAELPTIHSSASTEKEVVQRFVPVNLVKVFTPAAGLKPPDCKSIPSEGNSICTIKNDMIDFVYTASDPPVFNSITPGGSTTVPPPVFEGGGN